MSPCLYTAPPLSVSIFSMLERIPCVLLRKRARNCGNMAIWMARSLSKAKNLSGVFFSGVSTLSKRCASTAAASEGMGTTMAGRSMEGNLADISRKYLLRPLSPHLPVYKPQVNSTFSIFNRIAGAFLSANILAFYLLSMKVGPVGFTYSSVYQTFFYSSKLILTTVELSVLALAYHIVYGMRHLLGDFAGVRALRSARRVLK